MDESHGKTSDGTGKRRLSDTLGIKVNLSYNVFSYKMLLKANIIDIIPLHAHVQAYLSKVP